MLDSVKSGHKICVVMSNDTDVTVALLHYMPIFLENGIEQLWAQAGLGDTTRHVPLHTLAQQMGPQLCSVLPALYSLTRCDILSRVGTKKAVLKVEQVKFLKDFGSFSTPSVA